MQEFEITFLYSTPKRACATMRLAANSPEEAREIFETLMREGYHICSVRPVYEG